jgi:outer membrane immunogenic protein
MRKILVTAALLSGFVTSIAAQAADLAVKAPYLPPPAPSWTGMYFGGFIGDSWVHGTLNSTFLANSQPFHENSVIGGVYLGYDYELANKFIFGGRVSLPLFNLAQTAVVPLAFPGVSESTKATWATTMTMNFGYDLGQWEPYIGVGPAFASNKATVITTFAGNASDTELHVGVNALAGIKYAFTRNWVAGLEYDYATFATQNYTFFLPGIAGVQGAGKANANYVVATLEYRF